jgi:hypothetical protein
VYWLGDLDERRNGLWLIGEVGKIEIQELIPFFISWRRAFLTNAAFMKMKHSAFNHSSRSIMTSDLPSTVTLLKRPQVRNPTPSHPPRPSSSPALHHTQRDAHV